MSNGPQNKALGGGIFLAIAPLVGYLVGRSMGETSMGIVIGIGIGLAIAILFLFLKRR